jgi:hypothetical protein
MRASVLPVVVLASACGRLSFEPFGSDVDDGGTIDARPIDGPPPVPSNVTYNATTTIFANDAAGLNMVHTVTNANTALVVFVATRNSSPEAPPSVTSVIYGPQIFTRVLANCPGCGTGGINNLEMWFLPDAAVGSANLGTTLSGPAKGVSVIASSYEGASMVGSEMTAFADSATATVGWTNPVEGGWAIAGVMDQGGYALSLDAQTNQMARAETQCDTNNYQGSNSADQRGVAAGWPVTFSWTIGAGTGLNCITTPTPRDWIAIGASIY